MHLSIALPFFLGQQDAWRRLSKMLLKESWKRRNHGCHTVHINVFHSDFLLSILPRARNRNKILQTRVWSRAQVHFKNCSPLLETSGVEKHKKWTSATNLFAQNYFPSTFALPDIPAILPVETSYLAPLDEAVKARYIASIRNHFLKQN